MADGTCSPRGTCMSGKCPPRDWEEADSKPGLGLTGLPQIKNKKEEGTVKRGDVWPSGVGGDNPQTSTDNSPTPKCT